MIYKNRRFISGVIFIFLAIGNIFMFFTNSNRASLIILILCAIFGITEILISLNKEYNIEEKKSEDERQQYIYAKTGNTIFIITFFLCILLIIILASKGSEWWNVNLIGPMITTLSIIAFIMILLWISLYLFYNKKY